ncbi:MAG: acyl-ACP--UDP-N-acetylglucosamine O-acyltransferase [Waddliaceae bacterium]
MRNPKIHPTAIVEKGAGIGHNVTIEAYAIVKSSVALDDDVVIKSHAYIDGNTTIGQGTVVYPFASIGTKPQNLTYHGEQTFIKIGKYCEIRENVTINSSSGENGIVQIGDYCMVMAYCHLAHNSVLGNHVVMSNNATLAGHVTIEDYAIIGGLTPIHQFVRIGTYSMVGGLSRVTHDIPPYTIGAGIPFKFGGLNLIGLKRHGFSLKTRQELSKAFKLLYRSKLMPEEALKKIEQTVQLFPEVCHWIQFCRNSKRGLMGLQGVMHVSDEEPLYVEEETAYLPV